MDPSYVWISNTKYELKTGCDQEEKTLKTLNEHKKCMREHLNRPSLPMFNLTVYVLPRDLQYEVLKCNALLSRCYSDDAIQGAFNFHIQRFV